MTRLQQARAKKAKQRATQHALESVLDEMVARQPTKPSEVFLSIIEYGVDGLVAQDAQLNRVRLNHLVECIATRHGLR